MDDRHSVYSTSPATHTLAAQRMPARVDLGATILVVEDDTVIAALITEVLREEGYSVFAATQAREAIALLGVARVDLILADALVARSSEASGYWHTLDAIAARANETPIVIITAHQEQVFAGFRERGFAALVPKPFDLEVLVTTVRETLGPRCERLLPTPPVAGTDQYLPHLQACRRTRA